MNNSKTVSAPKSATNKNGNLSSAKKVDAKIIAKAKTETLKIAKAKTVNLWNEDNRTISAIGKWAKTSIGVDKAKLTEFMGAINDKYDTQYTVATINKKLLKFAYVHELNKVDDEYNVIKRKEFFSINFVLNLVQRRSKIKASYETFAKMQTEAKTRFIVRKAEAKASQELQAEFDAYAVDVVESFNA
jgi:hypothetical protein